MNRITNLPQTVLRTVLSRAQTQPNTLTVEELRFAARIRLCTPCGHLWVQRGKVPPRRCPSCHSTQWNLPSIREIAEADAARTERKAREMTQ
jgi:rubrerythrin